MKNLRQLKDLIKNMSRENNINAQILLRNYMLERLLERISLSDFGDKFILKGGMLIAALVGIDMRSTIDMDATIKSYPVTKESIEDAFDNILSVPIDDGVSMEFKGWKKYGLRMNTVVLGCLLRLEWKVLESH